MCIAIMLPVESFEYSIGSLFLFFPNCPSYEGWRFSRGYAHTAVSIDALKYASLGPRLENAGGIGLLFRETERRKSTQSISGRH